MYKNKKRQDLRSVLTGRSCVILVILFYHYDLILHKNLIAAEIEPLHIYKYS